MMSRLLLAAVVVSFFLLSHTTVTATTHGGTLRWAHNFSSVAGLTHFNDTHLLAFETDRWIAIRKSDGEHAVLLSNGSQANAVPLGNDLMAVLAADYTQVTALRQKDGTVAWTHTSKSVLPEFGPMAVHGPSETLFIIGEESLPKITPISGICIHTGKSKWATTLPFGSLYFIGPGIANNLGIVGQGKSGPFQALFNASSFGLTHHSFFMNLSYASSVTLPAPAVSADGEVLFLGSLMAYDTHSGALLWEKDYGNITKNSGGLALYSFGNIVVYQLLAQEVRAFDVHTGKALWTETGMNCYAFYFAAQKELWFAVSEAEYLIAYNMSDSGKLVWTSPYPVDVIGGHSLLAHGNYVYAQLNGDGVDVLGAKDGKEVSSHSPLFPNSISYYYGIDSHAIDGILYFELAHRYTGLTALVAVDPLE